MTRQRQPWPQLGPTRGTAARHTSMARMQQSEPGRSSPSRPTPGQGAERHRSAAAQPRPELGASSACMRGDRAHGSQMAETVTRMVFKTEQKLLTITIKVRLTPLSLSLQYQHSNEAIGTTRVQPERKIGVCQHGLATLNASSRTQRQQHGYNRF